MSTLRVSLLTAALATAGLSVAQAAPAPLPDAPAVQRYAAQLLDAERLDPAGPGLTVLVARDKQLLVHSARGQASVELGVPMKPDHVMRLGSITKQFAAATLLRLVDEGKAGLDDPLSKYLPTYPKGEAITLRMLLNHSSGVKSYTNTPGYMLNPIRSDLSTEELIAVFKDQPVDFAPGAQWAYNNSGYVLVGAVIEAITGQPWHVVLNQKLLAPATIGVLYPAPDRLVPNMVQGYSRGDAGVEPATLISMTQPHAAGALAGNVESLWRWNQALHEGPLLKPATYRQMVTPQGVAVPQNYGFGIGTGTLRGLPLLHHGGGINGFNTQMIYLPEQRITVAVLRNSDAGDVPLEGLARKLGAFAAGKGYPTVTPVAVSPDALKAYEGTYSLRDSHRRLRVVDGQLISQRDGSRPIPLIPLGNDRFAFSNGVAQVSFQRSAQGTVIGQTFYPDADEAGGGAEQWSRTGDLPTRVEVALNPDQQQALVGDYSGGPLTVKVFVDDKGQLRAQATGQPLVTLKATGPRELFLVEIDATLSFSPAEGPAQTMTLRQGRAVLPMQRK